MAELEVGFSILFSYRHVVEVQDLLERGATQCPPSEASDLAVKNVAQVAVLLSTPRELNQVDALRQRISEADAN